MKSLLKAIGVIISVAVALVVATIVILPLLIDPNDYKDEIAGRVKEQTGRELKIEGDIQLSVFPWLGFELGRVELGNAPGFEAPIFAASDQAGIRLKVLPLLRREIVMDTLIVRGLELNLEKNAKGETNWADLAKGPEQPGRVSKPGEELQMAAFAVGGLDISNANVSWKDAQAKQQFQVRDFHLETGALNPGKPVKVSLGFDLESSEPPLVGRVEGGGQLEMNPATQLIRATGFEVSARLKGEPVPGGETTLRVGVDGVVDGKGQSVRISSLRLNALGVNADIKLNGQIAEEGMRYSGSLNVAEFSPRSVLEQLGQQNFETADASALGKASLSAELKGTGDSVTVKPITLALDDSNLKGEVIVRGFAKPAVGFSFALDQIDADRYLPPAREGGEGAGASPGTATSAAAGLPTETLRTLDVVGKLAAGKLKVAKLTVSDFKASLKAKGGVITMEPVSANLYEGSYTGNIQLDARQDTPRVSMNEKLQGIQAGPLLKDLHGKETLTGKGDISISVHAIGADPDSLKKTLSGNAAFVFRDGAIKGVNVARMIREAQAVLKGRTLQKSDEPLQTDFAEMSGTLKITDGLVKNPDFEAKSPLLRITGSGQADLPTEKLNYSVQAKIVGTSKGQGGRELEELAGLTIPIKVSGSFADPKYSLDAEALGRSVAGSKAKQLIQEKLGASESGDATSDPKEAVKEKAKELIKGLLGN